MDAIFQNLPIDLNDTERQTQRTKALELLALYERGRQNLLVSTNEGQMPVAHLSIPDVHEVNVGELGLLSQSPLVDPERPGLLYTGSRGDGERPGVIHALNLNQGSLNQNQVLWSRTLPDHCQMPDAFAIWRDYLLVAPQSLQFLSDTKALLLLHRETGQVAHEVPLPARSLSAPAVDGDRVYLVGNDGTLFCVELGDKGLGDKGLGDKGLGDKGLGIGSEVLWSKQIAMSPGITQPVVHGGRLVLPANDNVLRCVDLNSASRQMAWQISAPGPTAHFMPTPEIGVDTTGAATVYAANWNGSLFAIDLMSGEVRWRFDVPAPPNGGRTTLSSAPVLAGGPEGELVLVASHDHHIYALARASGKVRWQSMDFRRRIYSRPLAMGEGEHGVVYVSPYRKELWTLRLPDGALLHDASQKLADRARGDFVLAGDWLAFGGNHGRIHTVPVVQQRPEVAYALETPIAELVAAKEVGAAALQHIDAGRLDKGRIAEAAHLLTGIGLDHQAAHFYEQAGELALAAQCYVRDATTDARRRAVTLYRQLKQPADVAQQLEALERWPDAAQAWEQAQNWTEAAKIYATHLGEPTKAAELYIQAGRYASAADIYQETGDLTAAIACLEKAGADTYRGRLDKLRKAAFKQGQTEHLGKLIESAKSAAERADLYEAAKEWTQAAEARAEAGQWRKAVDLLVSHGHGDRAIQVAQQQDETPAKERAAALLVEAKRFGEAQSLYVELDDRIGQAHCLQQLEQPLEAAQLYQAEAEAQEHAKLSPELESQLAEWFEKAASLYKAAFHHAEYLACRRKVHFYRRWAWLVPELRPEKAMVKGSPNVVTVLLVNEGRGLARDVSIKLIDQDNWVSFMRDVVVDGIAPQRSEENIVQMISSAAGDITISVQMSWTNPDGSRDSVKLRQPWVVTVVDGKGFEATYPSNINNYVQRTHSADIDWANLSGPQQGEFVEAMLDAYPTQNSLEQMLRFKMNVELNQIADPGNTRDVMTQVVRWSVSQSRTEELYRKAHESNPGNVALRELEAKLKQRASQ